MAVDVGSAVGYLDLDIKGFLAGLREAQEAAAGEMKKVEKTFSDKLNSIADSCNKWGKSLSLSITAPLTAVGGTLLKLGMNYETAMTNIKAITQMTAEELSEMQEGINGIARSTGYTITELATQAKMVAEAGGDMNLMMEQLEHGANLARASGTDLGTTLDMVGSAMKVFGLEAEETQRVVDSFALATTLANPELSAYGEALTNVGGNAAQLGLSLDEVNAFLVTFANRGLEGGAAGTALNGVLINLSAPTEKAAEELANLGVALYDSSGSSRDMMEIMQDLLGSLEELTPEQRNLSEAVIFDRVSRQAWNRITAEGIETITELAEELANAGAEYEGLGQAAGMAEEQIGTTAMSFQKLWIEVGILGQKFLEIVEGPLKKLLEAGTELLEWFGELDPSVQTTIVAIAAFAAAVGPLLIVLGTLAKSITAIIAVFGVATKVGTFLWGLGAVKVGISGFVAVLATIGAPVAIVIGAIAAIGAAIMAIIYNWDAITEATSAFWDWFSTGWSDFGSEIATLASAAWEGIKSGANSLMGWFGEKWVAFWGEEILKEWGKIWTDIYSIVTHLMAKIGGYFAEWTEWFNKEWVRFWNGIGKSWNKFWSEMANLVVGILKSIGEVVTAIGKHVAGIGKVIWDAGAAVVKQVFEIGKNIVDGVWRGILEAKNQFIRNVTDFFSGIVKTAKNALGISSPSKLFADAIGCWIPAGIAEGFEDAMPQALKEMQKCLDAGMGMLAANDVELAYNFAPSGMGGGRRQETGGSDWGGETAGGSGGNTYNFFSPEPISEAVARREVEELNRRLAFGF